MGYGSTSLGLLVSGISRALHTYFAILCRHVSYEVLYWYDMGAGYLLALWF